MNAGATAAIPREALREFQTIVPGPQKASPPMFLARTIQSLISLNVSVKEIQLCEGEEISYDAPGGYQSLEHTGVSAEDILELMTFTANKRYDPLKRLAENGHYDDSLPCNDRRLRCNFYRTQGRLAASIRTLPQSVPSYAELNGPEHLLRLVDRSGSGLFLITGPVGVGKSTTIASLLDHLNEQRGGHILTLEDPIEYELKPKKARISQRAVGVGGDVPSFVKGLEAAKRQNASIIMVGELRDAEAVKIALQAAESGAMVFASTHAASVGDTFDTLMSYFDAAEREHLRNVLANTFRAICSQRLLPSIDYKSYVLAYEYLGRSPAVVKFIRDANFKQVKATLMEPAHTDGTTGLNTCLTSLVAENKVSPAQAMRVTNDQEDLCSRLHLDPADYM